MAGSRRGRRLVEAGGRPALAGTWVNAREGTRGAFACRLEEEHAPAAAAAAAAGAGHYSGLWVGEAKPADGCEGDVPVTHMRTRRNPSLRRAHGVALLVCLFSLLLKSRAVGPLLFRLKHTHTHTHPSVVCTLSVTAPSHGRSHGP